MKKMILYLFLFVFICISSFFLYNTIFSSKDTIKVIENNQTYDVVISEKTKTKNAQQILKDKNRKKEILVEIQKINTELSKELVQSKINELAQKKQLLIDEYAKLEGDKHV